MTVHFKQLELRNTGLLAVIAGLLALIVCGAYAAHAMESSGHWISGMNNQVVWGLPHIFAIFLILAASGALNVASMGSVFGLEIYKPWGRFSALLAICLLVGGLIILVLDLGRPERLIVAMTHYNFKSIFAWNIFLYSGFIVIAMVYLVTMMERRLNWVSGQVGLFAFVWRFVLTSGTGSIFGFLVARQFFDAAMMVPIFIVLSLILGTAMFILLALLIGWFGRVEVNLVMLQRVGRLLGIFIAAELLLATVFHLTNLYATEHHGVERFVLLEGGIYTSLFWLGQIAVGAIAPLVMIFVMQVSATKNGLIMVCVLTLAGGLSQLYVTIIGGQAYPLVLFPGKKVSSSFYDGVVANYTPALYELGLGLGGVALAILLVVIATRVLPFLPETNRLTDQAPAMKAATV